MTMTEEFFSVDYAGRGDLFEGLSIWKEEKYQKLQGTYPVISLSFARIQETDYTTTKEKICQILTNLYVKYSFIRDSEVLTDADRLFYDRMELLPEGEKVHYELALTNYEVKRMFENMVSDWFQPTEAEYQEFVSALLEGDLDAMNEYMNQISIEIFSSFDTGKRISKKAQPERFYHGFVLGLLVDLRKRYMLTSNRESGFGRYDIMLEPKNPQEDEAIIIEFKVFNARREQTLEDTLLAALAQIEEKQYEANLIAKGIDKDRIRKYGFAFEGKIVLIGE